MGRKVLDAAGAMVKPGVTTEEIDIEVHRMCMEMNAYPSPLNYNYFPKSCCTFVFFFLYSHFLFIYLFLFLFFFCIVL